MSKQEVEISRKEFRGLYETAELCNRGLIIDDKAVIFKSKMSYAISRNIRDLKNLYTTDKEHSNKILAPYADELKKLRDIYSIKDVSGKYIPIKGKEIELNNAFSGLKEKYKEVIAENDKFLEEKEKVSVYMVGNDSFADLPQDLADNLFLMRLE